MICGGYRCTGAEYAELISDFGISDFEITDFEVVHETDKTVQVQYRNVSRYFDMGKP